MIITRQNGIKHKFSSVLDLKAWLQSIAILAVLVLAHSLEFYLAGGLNAIR